LSLFFWVFFSPTVVVVVVVVVLLSSSLTETRETDKNEKSLSRFSVRVRRDDRDAPEIDRRGDVFIVPGVHRGGVFGDWDTRQHGRFVVVLSLFFRIDERLFRYFWKTTASTTLSLSLSLERARY